MADLLRPLRHLLRAPGNELGFLLRSTLRFRRGRAELANEPKGDLFAALPPSERSAAEHRVTELISRYALAPLFERSLRRHWLSTLAHLDGLERLCFELPVPHSVDGACRAIDVGSGDFHYAFGLARFLSHHGRCAATPRPVVLRGVEFDGHGIYRDGRARCDHAEAQARLASVDAQLVRYEVADFVRRQWPEQDVVTLLFPFLSAHACLAWGAPLSRLAPRRLLQHAVATLRPGGLLVVVNQTEAEFTQLQQLLSPTNVDFVAAVGWHCAFVPWRERTRDQVGSVWRARTR